MKKFGENEARALFANVFDTMGGKGPAYRVPEGGGLQFELDLRIAGELATTILGRWLITAEARPGDTTEAFGEIFRENKVQAEGAIVAIVKLIRDIGDCRRPELPGSSRN